MTAFSFVSSHTVKTLTQCFTCESFSSVHYKTDTVLSPLLTLFCAILCTRGITEIEVFLCSNFFLAQIVIRIFLAYILLN